MLITYGVVKNAPKSMEKIKRYFQTTSAVGGLAARVASEHYLNIPINDAAYAKELRNTLGNLKGPLMKIAQFLSTIPDAIPKEYADELLTLQSHAPSMGVPFVKRRMTSELGPKWQERFQSFDLQASFAASLGQVHRATHLNGDALACKLQYPGMIDMVEADLNQLRLIFSLYEQFNKSIRTKNIHKEIMDRLTEELDYEQELKNLEAYQDFFKDSDRIKVPHVYKDLSTKRLLTMEWIQGDPVLTKVNASQEYRNALGKTLFEGWYKPLYQKGMLHADPHPGNYLVDDDGILYLLDFGCVRYFSPNFLQGVKDLYRAIQKNDRDLAVHAYTKWGFDNLTNEVIEIITQWAKLLYDPLLDDCVRPIQKTTSGKEGFALAQKIHRILHDAGGITPPQEFVFMDRAAVGLGSVLMRLNAEANWHQLFEEMIHD